MIQRCSASQRHLPKEKTVAPFQLPYIFIGDRRFPNETGLSTLKQTLILTYPNPNPNPNANPNPNPKVVGVSIENGEKEVRRKERESEQTIPGLGAHVVR